MQETIGQRLKRAREYRNISLEKAGEITRIRPALLKALEADDFSSMVSAAQARGFLRNYSEYLGLHFDQLLAQVERKPAVVDEISSPINPEQIVGPLEKLDRDATGSIRTHDPSRAKRELPFWKRTMSMLPSKESQLLEAEEPEIKPTQVEISAQSSETDESKPGLTSDAAGTVKSSETEGREGDESHKEQDLIELEPDFKTGSTGEEGREENLDQAVESKPAFISRTQMIALKVIDRIKATFKIRLKGLKVSSEQANIDANLQSDAEQADLPEGLTEVPGKSVEDYFAEIGEKLRERRALLSLTFEEIERHTHIRTPFLKAMENGTHDQLPSPVQTRGLLSNYASFLDLDADQLLLIYAAALQARHRERHPELAGTNASMRTKPILPPIRTFIASDVLFAVGVVGIILGLAIWGLGRLLNPPAVHESVQSTAPSIAEVLAGTAIAEQPLAVTLITAQDTPLPTFEATQEIGQGDQELASDAVRVQVSLLAVARTFVRVTSDGEVVFNDQVIPGNSYPFEADEQLEVLVGNGAALKVTYAGRDFGLMGNLGEVVDRIYTLSGISTPTITPLPTTTSTPALTSTPMTTKTATPTP